LHFISQAIECLKLGNYLEAAEILKRRISQGNLNSESKFQLCEWVAECYKNSGDYEEAGKWFEEAAKVAIGNNSVPSKKARYIIATQEFQKALDCYMNTSDHNLIRRASAEKYKSEQEAAFSAFP
jgi:tetratricopeptide (TPR) repeat protein